MSVYDFHFVKLATRLCRNGQWTGTQPVCSKNSNIHFNRTRFYVISNYYNFFGLDFVLQYFA